MKDLLTTSLSECQLDNPFRFTEGVLKTDNIALGRIMITPGPNINCSKSQDAEIASLVYNLIVA